MHAVLAVRDDLVMPAPRVLIVDDHVGYRALARELLESEGLEVVGEAADGRSARHSTQALRPEVVLVDVHLADEDGFAVAEQLRGLAPRPLVVLISSHDPADFVDRLPGAGVGFIRKDELSAAAIRDLIG
ncbi:MAG TPA: response regulator transcription factor [Ilumatobacter sp.]|nr:response regulator transcription factor [Ilumatobacter sp.]